MKLRINGGLVMSLTATVSVGWVQARNKAPRTSRERPEPFLATFWAWLGGLYRSAGGIDRFNQRLFTSTQKVHRQSNLVD